MRQHSILRSAAFAAVTGALVTLTPPALAQDLDQPEALLADAVQAYAEANGANAGPDGLRAVRAILDKIIQEYPSSDIAVRILLQDTIDGIDVRALDDELTKQALAGAPLAPAAPAEPVIEPAAPEESVTTVETPSPAAVPVPDATARTPVVAPEPLSPAPAAAPAKDSAMTDLRTSIAVCYAGDPGVPGDTRVLVGFALDEFGRLVGIPEQTGDNDTAAARRLFLKGMIALEDCSPFAMIESAGRYEIEFGPFGIERLTPQDEVQSTAEPVKQDLDQPITTPATISPPRSIATEESEAILGLDRTDRKEIQVRLSLLGFDPQGSDGIFGPKSRSAIIAWQLASEFPASGFLDDTQLALLKDQSSAQYADWRARQPAKTLRRVKVCDGSFLGVRICHYEYR